MRLLQQTFDYICGSIFYPVLVVLFTILVARGVKWYMKRRAFVQAIDKLPGPLSLPVLGNAFQLMSSLPGNIFKKFTSWSSEYKNSHVFRVWIAHFPLVVLNSPEAVEAVLRSPRHTFKDYPYSYMRPWLGNGLLSTSSASLRSKRKLITHSFHFSILEDFVEVFNEQSLVLMEKLRLSMISNGEKGFDIIPAVGRCTLDVVCATAMGRHKDAQNYPDSEYVHAIRQVAKLIIRRAVSPWLHPEWIFSRTSCGKEQKRYLEILHGFTNQLIRERKLAHQNKEALLEDNVQEVYDQSSFPKKKRMAFLDLLIAASEDVQVLTDEEIREETDTIILGGHSTITAGISWSTLLIGSHPEVQEKVYEEIINVIGNDINRPITMKDLPHFKYLECCIKETLRIYPVVPIYSRALKEDVAIGNSTIPAGCTVVIPAYAMHRLPLYYPEPEAFIPERFFSENSTGRPPFAYVPFSAGPRNCIGQKFAVMELKVVLVNLFRHFHVKALDKWEDFKFSYEISLQPQGPVRCILTPRSSDIFKPVSENNT